MRLEHFTSEEREKIRCQLPKTQEALKANAVPFQQFHHPLLLAGDQYPGIWLEHNQDNLFLADLDPQAAWNHVLAFMKFQRPDGLIPFMLPLHLKDENQQPARYSQLQTVYPFARCALELARKTGQPRHELEQVYQTAANYDRWIVQNRNRSGAGLVEMYCEYDTGHDNDPRVTDGGIPHCCPGMEAANMPDLPCMPILSVDLSATLYGGRMALADLAQELGRNQEAEDWRQKARQVQERINRLLYDPQDHFFYDLAPQGFRKYRTEHITRLFLNRVLTQQQFDDIYQRYFQTPAAGFLPDYPIPAVDVDDPHFDDTCPQNSWASNSQALTTLRAILWMDFYHREQDLTALLSIWLKAFVQNDFNFVQEINPFNGKAVPAKGNYTPALIIFIEAVKRLNMG